MLALVSMMLLCNLATYQTVLVWTAIFGTRRQTNNCMQTYTACLYKTNLYSV